MTWQLNGDDLDYTAADFVERRSGPLRWPMSSPATSLSSLADPSSSTPSPVPAKFGHSQLKNRDGFQPSASLSRNEPLAI